MEASGQLPSLPSPKSDPGGGGGGGKGISGGTCYAPYPTPPASYGHGIV